jgi:hypothetical protein
MPPIGMVIGSLPWHLMESIAWNNQSMCYYGPWRLSSHGQYLVILLWYLTGITWQCNFLNYMSHVALPIGIIISRFTCH